MKYLFSFFTIAAALLAFAAEAFAMAPPETVVVPEPVSTTLFLAGGAALGVRQWRKRRKER